MPLTAHDIKAAYAQWEEWTTDMGFLLRLDVREEAEPRMAMVTGTDRLGVRLTSAPVCQVRVFRHRPDEHIDRDDPETWGDRVFEETVPATGDALKASVSVLAKTIAAKWVPPDDE